MNKFKITGQASIEDDQSENGFVSADVDEVIEFDGSAEEAMNYFFEESDQYQFFGSLVSRGAKSERWVDHDESQEIVVEKIK